MSFVFLGDFEKYKLYYYPNGLNIAAPSIVAMGKFGYAGERPIWWFDECNKLSFKGTFFRALIFGYGIYQDMTYDPSVSPNSK